MLRNATQWKRLSIVLWKYNAPTFLCALKFVCRRPDFPNKSLREGNDIFYKRIPSQRIPCSLYLLRKANQFTPSCKEKCKYMKKTASRDNVTLLWLFVLTVTHQQFIIVKWEAKTNTSLNPWLRFKVIPPISIRLIKLTELATVQTR